MPDTLIYGDTQRSPALRHEIPLDIGDPFLGGMPYGGVRYEDLVLITDDGAETLTDYPYDLAP